jgi:hypothetical protein
MQKYKMFQGTANIFQARIRILILSVLIRKKGGLEKLTETQTSIQLARHLSGAEDVGSNREHELDAYRRPLGSVAYPDPDPHHFGNMDPDPHHFGKLDPDPHQSEK